MKLIVMIGRSQGGALNPKGLHGLGHGVPFEYSSAAFVEQTTREVLAYTLM